MYTPESKFMPLKQSQEQIDAESKVDWISCFYWFVLMPAIWISVVVGCWTIGVWIGRLLMGAML